MGRKWNLIGFWILVAALLVYLVILPTAQSIQEYFNPPDPRTFGEGMSSNQEIQFQLLEAVSAFLFFSCGAAIGSFLNVVVYRMPRGESVIFKPSSCPQCGSKIKGKDNIPIWGWLGLNGKCRSCQASISIRYPVVEFTVGTLFLLLYFCELISGGDNLPIRSPNTYRGVQWIIFYPKWDLISLYLFHCLALSLLLTWALVDLDRYRVRRKQLLSEEFRSPRIPGHWVGGLLVLFLAAACLLPDLQPVPWQFDTLLGSELSPNLSSLGTGLTGALTGAVLGWLASLATTTTITLSKEDSPLTDHEPTLDESGSNGNPDEGTPEKIHSILRNSLDQSLLQEPPSDRTHRFSSHSISGGMIVGMSVGWQAAIAVWLLAFALRPILNGMTRCCIYNAPPITTHLLIAYLVHLLCWRWSTADWWPSYSASATTWGLSLLGLGLLWGLNRVVSFPLRLQPETGGIEIHPGLLEAPPAPGTTDEESQSGKTEDPTDDLITGRQEEDASSRINDESDPEETPPA